MLINFKLSQLIQNNYMQSHLDTRKKSSDVNIFKENKEIMQVIPNSYGNFKI